MEDLVIEPVADKGTGYTFTLLGLSYQDQVAVVGQAAKYSVPCEGTVDDGLAALPDRLAQIFAAIRARAPKAQIVLVDDVRVVPPSGSCPDRAPLTAADHAGAFQFHARLAGAARANGVDLLPAAALSAGHDVCSAHPWVFGTSPPPAADPSFPHAPTIRTAAPWGGDRLRAGSDAVSAVRGRRASPFA